MRRKPIAENLVNRIPGASHRPLSGATDLAMLAQVGDGAIDGAGGLLRDHLLKLRLEARAVGKHQLRLLTPVTDRIKPTLSRSCCRRELQLGQMANDPIELAVKLAPIRSAQALDLLGKVLPIQRLVCGTP